MKTNEISDELATGIARWNDAANEIVVGLGGVGARVVATTPNGIEHYGVLVAVSLPGIIVRCDDGKRRMIQTSWERYDCADPDKLSVAIRRLHAGEVPRAPRVRGALS